MLTDINKIELWVQQTLPNNYRRFLGNNQDDVSVSDVLLLYGSSSFVERNETHETREYCPGCVTIGNDSGDQELILELHSGRILIVDAGSMRIGDADLISVSFTEWHKEGCPLPHEPELEYSPTQKVLVFLEKKPISTKTLLLIKTSLGISESISDLKQCAENAPQVVSDQLSYMQAINRCQKVNNIERCLSIRSLSDESIRLPLQWI